MEALQIDIRLAIAIVVLPVIIFMFGSVLASHFQGDVEYERYCGLTHRYHHKIGDNHYCYNETSPYKLILIDCFMGDCRVMEIGGDDYVKKAQDKEFQLPQIP